jgi:hypothetical protein
MIGSYKPFDKKLSDKFDSPGRAFIKRAAKKKWNVLADDYEKYEVDLICRRNGEVIGYAEVEVRPDFIDQFPFSTVHIPSRKAKLMDNGLPTVYFVVNGSFDRLLWIKSTDALNFDLKEVKNRLVPNGEMFYDVPVDQFTQVYVGS